MVLVTCRSIWGVVLGCAGSSRGFEDTGGSLTTYRILKGFYKCR
jgi:hypothetical protein